MKRIIPYILAYIIVATGTAIYPRIHAHFVKNPPDGISANLVAIVQYGGLSKGEFDAKLKQVGLSEWDPYKDKVSPPSRLPSQYSIVYHYVFDAVMLAAFAGLVIVFRRIFQADVPGPAV